MFTKALILVLLGSSLVVSSPVADPGMIDNIKQAYQSISSKVESLFQAGTEKLNQLNEKVQASIAHVKELGQDAVSYLNVQAGKIKDNALAKIEAVKAEAQAQIEKLKEAAKTTGQVITYEIDKINGKTKQSINDILDAADKALNQEIQNAKDHAAKKDQAKPH